jgi:hypothetical protein
MHLLRATVDAYALECRENTGLTDTNIKVESSQNSGSDLSLSLYTSV